MNKNNKHKLIPKLRFPEFQNEGEWEAKQIGDILKVESSSLAFNKLELKKSGYAVYGADSIVGYIDTYQHSERYISIVKDGSGVGRLNLCKPETSILGTLSALKSKNENKYLIVWAYYLLNTIDFSSYVKGAGIPHIYYSDYKHHTIGVAKPAEQQKIASCLSSLDEVITGEQQKLELLKQHKKGLLQNLFPQAGETVPKLRFKEFENSGEWEVKRLGEVCEINPSISKLPKEFIYIDLESVKDGQLFQTKKISIDNAPSRAQRLLRKNDIIFQMVRPYQRNNLLFNLDGFNYVASTGYAQLRTSQSPEFLYYQLHTDFFVFRVLEKCTGTNYPAINTEELTKIEVFVPSLPEQQKIASCLSSLDEIITAQTQKIEQLQRHKKGLLQGLFPNINNE